MRHVTGFFCAAALLLGSAGGAEAKGMTIGQLKALVKDLGYQATSDDKSYVSLPDQGKWGRTVFIIVHDEGETLEIFSNFGELPDPGKTVVPFADLLAANDDENFVFAIGRTDGKPNLFLEGQLPAATMSKQLLRKTIDSWLIRIDATEQLWNRDHWPAVQASAPPSPAAAASAAAGSAVSGKAFCDPAVEKGPLKIESTSFRKGPAGGDSGAIVRQDSVFGSEEPMYLVLEITGFQCKTLDSGRLEALFTIDQGIKRSDDPDYDPFMSLSKTLDFENSEKFDRAFVDLTLTPHWKTSGRFSFRYTVHDNIKGAEASSALPLTIEPPK